MCRTEHFTRHYQGVSHAKWPKDNHECAPTQTGSIICCPLTDNAIAYLEMKFEEPELWDAFLALAKALPRGGRMEGCECWEIFSDAIETSGHSALASTHARRGAARLWLPGNPAICFAHAVPEFIWGMSI